MKNISEKYTQLNIVDFSKMCSFFKVFQNFFNINKNLHMKKVKLLWERIWNMVGYIQIQKCQNFHYWGYY